MAEEKRKRILSGIQPTGTPTLGNYIGAVRNWALLQSDYDCLYMVADLHSLTVRQVAADLRRRFAQRDGVIFFRHHIHRPALKALEMFPYRAAAKEHWLAGAEVDAVRAEIVKPPFQIPRVVGVEQFFCERGNFL